MFATLSRIASRLLHRPLTRRPVTVRTRVAPPRFRPRLEALDNRDVPAATTWLGGSVTSGSSWSGGTIPGSGDDLYFDGAVISAGCSGPPVNLSFSSIHVVNGYTGTISGFGSLSVG